MDDRLMFWGAMVVAGYTANTADMESQKDTGENCIVITETGQEDEGKLKHNSTLKLFGYMIYYCSLVSKNLLL